MYLRLRFLLSFLFPAFILSRAPRGPYFLALQTFPSHSPYTSPSASPLPLPPPPGQTDDMRKSSRAFLSTIPFFSPFFCPFQYLLLS
jgi:hypothetical protein